MTIFFTLTAIIFQSVHSKLTKLLSHHLFIYKIPADTKPDYVFQDKEVAGMVKIEVSEFEKIWSQETFSVIINGESISKDNFVPHENSYISSVMNSIKQYIL